MEATLRKEINAILLYGGGSGGSNPPPGINEHDGKKQIPLSCRVLIEGDQMEFCSKCKVLMFPKGDMLICNNCGATKKKTGASILVVKCRQKEVIIFDRRYGEDIANEAKRLARQNRKSR